MLLLVSAGAFCQDNLKPGLVVKNNGDTLRGYINYRNWEYNPAGFEFSENQTGPFTTIATSDYQYVSITGLDIYQRFTVSKITAPAWALSEWKKEEGVVSTTAFLRLIVSGSKLSLYELNERYRPHFYIKPPDGEPEELIYKEYIDTTNMIDIVKKTEFRGQLTRYTNNNRKLIKAINSTAYLLSAIRKVVKDINGSNNIYYNRDFYNQQFKRRIRYFAGAGYSSAGLSYTVNHNPGVPITFDPLESARFQSASSPLLTIGADVVQSRQLELLTLRTELQLVHFKYSDFSKHTLFGKQYTSSSDLEYTVLSPSLSGNINIYRTARSKFYIGAGVLYGFFFFTNATSRVTDDSNGSITNYKYEFKKGNAAMKFNVGGSVGRIDFGISQQTNLNHVSEGLTKSNQHIFVARAAYLF